MLNPNERRIMTLQQIEMYSQEVAQSEVGINLRNFRHFKLQQVYFAVDGRQHSGLLVENFSHRLFHVGIC